MTTARKRSQGFSLIEVLITTIILVTGLAAVAGVFSQGAQSNLRNRQRAGAATLLTAKMEELKSADELPPGDLVEYLSIRADGTVSVEDSTRAMYLRTAKVSDEAPQRITVIVYGRQSGRGNIYRELLRATTLVADGF